MSAVQRVFVTVKSGLRDSFGEAIAQSIKDDLGLKVRAVRVVKVYMLKIDVDTSILQHLAEEVLSDRVAHEVGVNVPLQPLRNFSFCVEVGYKPGVTDNEAATAKEAIKYYLNARDIDCQDLKVATSRQFFIQGKLTKEQTTRIAKELLMNELIERCVINSADEWKKQPKFLRFEEVHLQAEERVEYVNLDMPDEELERLAAQRLLALTVEELKVFRNYFKQQHVAKERAKLGLKPMPTDAELECFAQTQSEHCKHKVFNANIFYVEDGKEQHINGLMKSYIKRSTEDIRRILGKRDFCVSVFKDNAGIIKFDDTYNLVFKVETHNSPSALDPYGGALTGIVGVNRDPLGTGLGAELLFNTDVFCFGSPFTPKDKVPRGVLHPRRIFKGVRLGVEHGGNRIGIPTVNGSIYFDDSFIVRPLVYCGTGGIMPARIAGRTTHDKQAKPGDLIVMAGGRIGKDGIHGATFSSTALSEESPTSAVQIGAPIVQKRLMDALLEARDKGLYNSITDNGAGGLSSSVGEMALQSGGAELHLDRAKLKYPGLQPWEILLSESQERMTLAVPREKLDELMEIFKKHGVEASVLGQFNDSGKFHVLYKGRSVVYLDLEFLHYGLPPLKLKAVWKRKKHKEPRLEEKSRYDKELLALLSDLNICSKEWVIRQYDHEVQARSVVKPLVGAYNDGPSDAAVLKPLYNSWRGIAVSHGINPQYSLIDCYHMAANCVDEAVRNAVCVGASVDHMALLDNFSWPDPKYHPQRNPDGQKKLGMLVRACKALYDYTVAYRTPLISGKDSLSSDRVIDGVKYSIKPTLLVSAIAVVKDVRKAVTMDVKQPRHHVYVLGLTKNELGGSAFYRIKGYVGNNVPKVNAELARKLYETLNHAMEQEIIESCHDCSDGGLAVALAESAFAGNFGMKLSLSTMLDDAACDIDYNYQLLFSESPSRFVVTVRPACVRRFERMFAELPYARLGRTTSESRLVIEGLNNEKVVDVPISRLKDAWQRTLRW